MDLHHTFSYYGKGAKEKVWSNLFILQGIWQHMKRLLSTLCGNWGDEEFKAHLQMTTITTKEALKMIGRLCVSVFWPLQEALVIHDKKTTWLKSQVKLCIPSKGWTIEAALTNHWRHTFSPELWWWQNFIFFKQKALLWLSQNVIHFFLWECKWLKSFAGREKTTFIMAINTDSHFMYGHHQQDFKIQ